MEEGTGTSEESFVALRTLVNRWGRQCLPDDHRQVRDEAASDPRGMNVAGRLRLPTTGAWLEEIAAPYNMFVAAGLETTISSTKGGGYVLVLRSG